MAELAVVALVAGEAAVTAATVLTAVAEVGTAMSIVGAVTGSKDLMKIGGTMAMVGGLGGLAEGALSGAAADAASTTVLDEAASQAGADALTASLDQGANAMATGVTDAATAQAGANQLSGQLDQQAINQAQPIGQSTIANNPSALGQPTQQVANPLTDNSAVQTAADSGVSNPMSNGVVTPNDQFNVSADLRNWGGTPKISSENFFGKFGTWAAETMSKPGNIGGALSGAAKAYEADRNYQLGKDKLGLIQQQMNWGNSVPTYNFKA